VVEPRKDEGGVFGKHTILLSYLTWSCVIGKKWRLWRLSSIPRWVQIMMAS
jgi:hypothetical protein